MNSGSKLRKQLVTPKFQINGGQNKFQNLINRKVKITGGGGGQNKWVYPILRNDFK